MRQHYRDVFNSEQQTDNILLEVLNLVRIHIAMYGYGGFADNEPRDTWYKVFPHEHRTLGRFYGDLDSHQILGRG